MISAKEEHYITNMSILQEDRRILDVHVCETKTDRTVMETDKSTVRLETSTLLCQERTDPAAENQKDLAELNCIISHLDVTDVYELP